MAYGDKPRNQDRWWHGLFVAALLFGAAVYFYVDLTRFETEGGQRRIHWLLALLYYVLGKEGVAGGLVLGGVACLSRSLVLLVRQLRGTAGGATPPR